jgi:hypothetical protein
MGEMRNSHKILTGRLKNTALGKPWHISWVSIKMYLSEKGWEGVH